MQLSPNVLQGKPPRNAREDYDFYATPAWMICQPNTSDSILRKMKESLG